MRFDDHLSEDQFNKLHVASVICQILVIVALAVLFVANCILLLVSCKNRTFRNLPTTCQLCIVLYAWQVAYTLAIQIAILVEYPFIWEALELTHWQRLFQMATLAWRMLMWHFAAHYMKTACLFKKTFSARKDEDFEKLQRQKTYLLSIEWGFQSIQILMSVFWFIYVEDVESHKMNYVSVIIDMFTFSIISLVAVLSQNHIQKHSAPVEKLGIVTNANFRNYQVVLWVALFLCNLLNILWLMWLKIRRRNKEVNSLFGQLMVQTILSTAVILISIALQMLVLRSYYLMSKRISLKAAKLMAHSLRPSSRTSEAIQVEGQELQDERRMKVHRKSASKHMR